MNNGFDYLNGCLLIDLWDGIKRNVIERIIQLVKSHWLFNLI